MNTQFANYFFSKSMHQVFNREVTPRDSKSVSDLQTELYQHLALKTANQN